MQRLKIVFSGPMGAGKTQAIASLSDIPVVSTEVKNTDLHANTKALTTVGMDYGELVLEGGINIGLYGTPGQERFNFIWPILSQGAMGVIILIDHAAQDPVADLANYLQTFTKIYTGRISWVSAKLIKCLSATLAFIMTGWLPMIRICLFSQWICEKEKMCCYWLIPLLHHLN